MPHPKHCVFFCTHLAQQAVWFLGWGIKFIRTQSQHHFNACHPYLNHCRQLLIQPAHTNFQGFTASLGNLLQCLTTLIVKKSFLVSNLYNLCCNIIIALLLLSSLDVEQQINILFVNPLFVFENISNSPQSSYFWNK